VHEKNAAHALHVASDFSRALTFTLGIHPASKPNIALQRSHIYVFEMDHRVFYELGANAVADGGVVGILHNTLPGPSPDGRGQNQSHQRTDR
jgi:hypothetical protein